MELEELIKKLGGEFEFEKELGRGGYGTVYLVRNLSLDRREVMKVLNTTLDRTSKALFQQEAQIIANLDHEGIPTIYAID